MRIATFGLLLLQVLICLALPDIDAGPKRPADTGAVDRSLCPAGPTSVKWGGFSSLEELRLGLQDKNAGTLATLKQYWKSICPALRLQLLCFRNLPDTNTSLAWVSAGMQVCDIIERGNGPQCLDEPDRYNCSAVLSLPSFPVASQPLVMPENLDRTNAASFRSYLACRDREIQSACRTTSSDFVQALNTAKAVQIEMKQELDYFLARAKRGYCNDRWWCRYGRAGGIGAGTGCAYCAIFGPACAGCAIGGAAGGVFGQGISDVWDSMDG